MKKGTLTNGFKFSVDENIMRDAEFLDLLVEVDEGNILSYPKMTNKLLGADQKKKLYNKLRDKKSGIVDIEEVGKAIVEVLTIIGQEEDEGKNS